MQSKGTGPTFGEGYQPPKRETHKEKRSDPPPYRCVHTAQRLMAGELDNADGDSIRRMIEDDIKEGFELTVCGHKVPFAECHKEKDPNSRGVDWVNHPPHYQTPSGMEAVDVVEAFGLNYHLGEAVCYILRAGKKPENDYHQDLEKARWWLDRELGRSTDEN